MIELCGARARARHDRRRRGRRRPPRPDRGCASSACAAILGVPVARERQAEILRALDFASERARRTASTVTVPALRRDDVTREIDLIEEVARIDGLERLPATLPARRGAAGRLTHAQRVRRGAEDALVGARPARDRRLELRRPGAARPPAPARPSTRCGAWSRLENPLSEAQSIMRPTLLGSLLDAARHNVARNGPDDRALRVGHRLPRAAPGGGGESPADEHHALGVLLSGRAARRARGAASAREADFFAAKALLEALLERFARRLVGGAPAQWPFLHPGRSAAVLAAARTASRSRSASSASCTRSSPRAWDLARTAAFAIDLGKLAAAAPAVVALPRLRRRSRRCARTSP